jgi:GNAT superfamily N-acetyltransferase
MKADLPAIRALLVRANDVPYDIGKVAEEKCFGDGYDGPPRVRIVGNFEGVAVTCGKYLRILAVDRESRGRGIGSTLVHDSNASVIAAEPGNYFTPGVSEHVAGFFKRLGYIETARTQNLVCTSGGQEVVAAGDREQVLAFVEKNFGPIWRFEAAKGQKILHIEDRGEIAGFATYDANNHGLGWFGPTGVAVSHRGRGLGHVLLRASLADLRRLGYHRVVIPWTDAIEYYQKGCGARIDQRFVILRRKSA